MARTSMSSGSTPGPTTRRGWRRPRSLATNRPGANRRAIARGGGVRDERGTTGPDDDLSPAAKTRGPLPRGIMTYFWRVLHYLRPYWRLAVGSVIITIASVAASLLTPWPLKILVDNVLGSQPVPSILAGSSPGGATARSCWPWSSSAACS